MIKHKLNENYFNEESKSMYYILGTFYASYIPTTLKTGIIFQSSHKDLVQIVKEELESEHKIISYSDSERDRGSYFLRIYGVPKLKAKLEETGLDSDKEKREFPKKIDEEYISHFVRGFLDAKRRTVEVTPTGATRIKINFNKRFLTDLHKILIKYVGVEQKPKFLSKGILVYNHKDSLKIHDFIYRDWSYIKKHGLYIPSKKESFNFDYVRKKHINKKTIEAHERLEKAKKLLQQEKSIMETTQLLGLSHPNSVYRLFWQHNGESLPDWSQKNNVHIPRVNTRAQRRAERIEKAKKLLQNGMPIADVERHVGYLLNSIYPAFKQHIGQTLVEWRRKNVKQ